MTKYKPTNYRIGLTEICSIYPDISPHTTVEAVLAKMVKNGQIKRIGASRRVSYSSREHVKMMTWCP